VTETTIPRGLMEVDGKLVVRRVYLEPDPSAPIICRNDHVIHATSEVFDGIGAHQCRAMLGAGQACSAIVGVIEGSIAASVRFDLTADERGTIKHEQWRASQILEYLGLTL
jgi:hypothetical protein